MRKGNAKPSLAPASDEMISRKWRGTYLSANGPFAMDCDSTGSVGVTHDAMTSATSGDTLGTVARMHPQVRSHMAVMFGRRQSDISFHRWSWYFAGS